VIAVLGDHLGLTRDDEALLRRRGAAFCSLGPTPLLTSQCIVILQNALDSFHAQRGAPV